MTGIRNEKILLSAIVLCAVCLGIHGFIRSANALLVLQAVQPFFVVSLSVSLLVLFRYRLARLAEIEKRDRELERHERSDSVLFEPSDDAAAMTLDRSRSQFERFVVPLAAPILVLLQGLWAWTLFKRLGEPMDLPTASMAPAAFLCGESFILFLFSRYLIGLSRVDDSRWMRGPGVLLGLNSLACLFAAISSALCATGLASADRIAGLLLIALLALLAVESLLNTVTELYKPASRRQATVSYESRFARVLTDPALWARNLAQSLDYQFGFNVSETWIYRLLSKALIPLLIFQLLTLYSLSCVVFLGPGEEGLLEHLGQPRPSPLVSGVHFKCPWPFETVRRFPVNRILALRIGFTENETDKAPDVLLWTVPHFAEEDQFLTASRTPTINDDSVPVNLVSVNMPIEYRITNIYQYAYGHSDPGKVLGQLARRVFTIEAATHDLGELLGEGKLALCGHIKERLQAETAGRQLGVEIVFVGLSGIHPPVAVADAYESVVGALEEKEATILKARAYANKTLPVAGAEADRSVANAEAYRKNRAEQADAESELFTKRLKAFHASPRVFRTRYRLDSLRTALTDVRKYIVTAAPSNEVLIFDFEEKIHPDLFDLGPAPEGGKAP